MNVAKYPQDVRITPALQQLPRLALKDRLHSQHFKKIIEMATINPYLVFDGKCQEAMHFYQQCLGGELHLQTVGESTLADQMPPEYKNAILHSSLSNKQWVIMASDMHRSALNDGNSVHLCIVCHTEEELNTFFSRLSQGGEVISPIAEMPWQAKLGELRDRFGKFWVLHYDKNVK